MPKQELKEIKIEGLFCLRSKGRQVSKPIFSKLVFFILVTLLVKNFCIMGNWVPVKLRKIQSLIEEETNPFETFTMWKLCLFLFFLFFINALSLLGNK